MATPGPMRQGHECIVNAESDIHGPPLESGQMQDSTGLLMMGPAALCRLHHGFWEHRRRLLGKGGMHKACFLADCCYGSRSSSQAAE